MSLDTYYILVQGIGVLVWFSLGLTRLSARRLNGSAIVLGIAVNLAVQLPEGGPGLCLGIVILPLWAMGFAWLGRATRHGLTCFGWLSDGDASVIDGPRCEGCGYLLIGLAEKRCPECGRLFDNPVSGSRMK